MGWSVPHSLAQAAASALKFAVATSIITSGPRSRSSSGAVGWEAISVTSAAGADASLTTGGVLVTGAAATAAVPFTTTGGRDLPSVAAPALPALFPAVSLYAVPSRGSGPSPEEPSLGGLGWNDPSRAA